MTSNERLINTIRFMLDRMIADKYHRRNPMTWGHIIRELRRCGLEVKQ